jgi:hypothetical protein
MTDDEADRWLTDHGEYECTERIGLMIYGLKRRGGPSMEYVGFLKETGGNPDPTLVKRFLVRWFIDRYGA